MRFIQLIFVLLITTYGCDEKNTTDLNEFHPFQDDSYKGNNPFNYINYNTNSVFVFKDGGSDGASIVSILEIPNEKTNIDDSSVTFVRYYDFDIEMLNSQLTKRKFSERDRVRSQIRNYMTYIFALDCDKMPSLTHYKHFNKKEFEKVRSNTLRKNGQLKISYFIFDPVQMKTIWINPYDGYSTEEYKLLKWISRFMPKISYVEKYCFDKAMKKTLDLQDYFKMTHFIIPKEEVFAGMYKYPDSED